MKMEFLPVLLVCFTAATAIAQEADAPQPAVPRETAARHDDGDIASLGKLAMDAVEKNHLDQAETLYIKILERDAPDDARKTVLRQMAGMYEKKRIFSKAIAVYEKAIQLYPLDPKTPEMLLNVGLIYRESGAHQMAISKFYAVLNSTLKIDRRDFSDYKLLTQRAQFEIAETYFLVGDYGQADKFFTMLKRLDLNPEDKARAEFRSIYCRFLLNDFAGTITSSRLFVKSFSNTKYVPECRYILATALRRLNRTQEATDETLVLLRGEKPKEKEDPENWAYWQKKTGNQIANDLYQEGEFIKALTIYQTLAKLNSAPDWQLPVIYQIGLCFERLRLLPRSLEAYRFILDECKKAEAKGALPSSLETLRQMAQWRSDQIAWIQDTDVQLQSLLGAKSIPSESPASANSTP